MRLGRNALWGVWGLPCVPCLHLWFRSQMFFGPSAFNQNLASWNMATVSNMTQACSLALASLLRCTVPAPPCGSVVCGVRALQMFYKASAFNQTIAGWNTASVANMVAVRSLPFASMRAVIALG